MPNNLKPGRPKGLIQDKIIKIRVTSDFMKAFELCKKESFNRFKNDSERIRYYLLDGMLKSVHNVNVFNQISELCKD